MELPVPDVGNADHNSNGCVDSPETVIVNIAGPPVTAIPVSPNIGISCKFLCMLADEDELPPVKVMFLLNTPSTSI